MMNVRRRWMSLAEYVLLLKGGQREMKISARNVLKGKVKNVVHGAVNSEVTLELPGGTEVVSIITKSSAERLGLTPGKETYAVIKASSVMLAVD
jgi:molybdopterin-binding protein